MNIIEWMIAEKLAENTFAAAHIANGLKLAELPNDEARQERVRLYRRHRPMGSSHTKFKTVDAYREAIAGREPLVLDMGEETK